MNSNLSYEKEPDREKMKKMRAFATGAFNKYMKPLKEKSQLKTTHFFFLIYN
jgi:hypothetical protein